METTEERVLDLYYDIETIRADFPILSRKIRGKDLIYLDNAATTQKPLIVINTIKNFYDNLNSNIHRGVHYLSQESTTHYEKTRQIVRDFIGARSTKEIIYTRGTTESINLVASTWGRANIKEGDEIIISHMEHHSNIVPWQMLCEEKGAVLKVVPINDAGEFMFEEYKKLLSDKTKFVSIVHVSNSLGTVNPVKDIIREAHKYGAVTLLDAAQSIQHKKMNVKYFDCDFMAFSGHKIYGPTGIGVLYGKEELLNEMPPYQGGGDMIESVSFEKTTYNELPYKFEAGTPHIVGAIGLGEAIRYIARIGLDQIDRYEQDLLKYVTDAVSQIDGVRLIGTAQEKASVCSFVLDTVHPHDIGTMLDMEGIAIRTGHHCTEPVMKRFNVPATSRVSLSFYNTKYEIDVLAESLEKVIKMFS